MKTITDRRMLLWGKTVFFLIVVFLSGITAQAIHEPKGLGGPAFTDPSQIMDMPDAWKKQPIKHDSSIGSADIVITLDQQMHPSLLPIIQKYAREHNLRIAINKGTCGISAGMLARKVVDIGGYCCAPGVTDRLPGLRFHTMGIAPLALIIHPDNPINNITIGQARKIFQGEIYRWSELRTAKGGKGANLLVQPVVRLHCKLRPGSWRLLLKGEDLFSPDLIEVGAIPDMIAQVSANEGAIGYEVIWEVHRYKQKRKVKTLKINGYAPNELSHLVAGSYPLYRVYSLTTWEEESVANPQAHKLVEYLLQQVEHLDSKFAFIPASRLKKAGWKFNGDELIGEPK